MSQSIDITIDEFAISVDTHAVSAVGLDTASEFRSLQL